MSLPGRVNRLVRTMGEKGFYNEKDIAPGEFTPEVIAAIENFRDSASWGRNTQVVINAFRVFDGDLFRSVGRNCPCKTDSVVKGINACIKKYSVQREISPLESHPAEATV